MAQVHKQTMQLIETHPPHRNRQDLIDINSSGRRSSSLSRLQRDIAACRLCSSLNPWRQFQSDAYGTRCTGYLLVGEAPGYKSWAQRRRFTGPAGALRQVAHPQYRDLEDLFYMTDVVKCHPASDVTSITNRSPRRCEVEACVGYLSREIHVLQPSVIVTFGKTAAEAVAQVSHPSHGQMARTLPYKVMSFPHPSPGNQLTIRKYYASMQTFEAALARIFSDLIAQLERRSLHA